MTSQLSTKKQTCTYSRLLLGRMVHKGYNSRYLAAHNCTTSSFRAAFQFLGLLGAPCIVSLSFVFVVSPVWMWLSLWAKVPSSSDECASESDSNISYLMSWSVWFLLVAMLLNALGRNLAHTKRNPFWLIVFKAFAFPGLSHVVIMEWIEVVSWRYTYAWMYILKESGRNPYRRMKDICLWSHIALNVEINICMHYFPVPLIAYELTGHSFRLSQYYHEIQTSLWDWNLNSVRKHMMICTFTSKFYSTRSPLTAGAIWKE
jgi:hypothetical protein